MSLYGTLPRRRSVRPPVPSTLSFYPKSPDSGIVFSSLSPSLHPFPSSFSSVSPVSAAFSSSASSSASSGSSASSASSHCSYNSGSRLTLNSFGIQSGKALSRIDSASTLISSSRTHEYFVPSNLFSSPPPPPALSLHNSSNSSQSSSKISSFTRSTLQTRPLPLPSIQSLNSLHSDSLTEYSPDYAVIQPQAYNSVTSTPSIVYQRQNTPFQQIRDNVPKIFVEADNVEESISRNVPNFYGNTVDEDDDDDCDGRTRDYTKTRMKDASFDEKLFQPTPGVLTQNDDSNKKMNSSRFSVQRLSMRVKKLYRKRSESEKALSGNEPANSKSSFKWRRSMHSRLRQILKREMPLSAVTQQEQTSVQTHLTPVKSVLALLRSLTQVKGHPSDVSDADSLPNRIATQDATIIFEQSDACQQTLQRTATLPGFKKRPLSMTYDISRVTDDKAHMVAVFEQSLSTMTNRLQELTNSSDLKDCELDRLRRTIEALKHHGGALVQGVERTNQQRSASISGVPSSNASNNQTNDKLTTLSQRQPSNESVNSISSDKGKKASKSKFKSLTSQNANWIRSSFSKVLSKKKALKTGENSEVLSDNEDSCLSNIQHSGSAPGSPLPSVKSFKTNTSASGGSDNTSGNRIPLPESVDELQKALREKDMALTDMRLESLSSAHQLESVKETLTQMRLEMVSLKQDNERLQRLAKHKSLHGSSSSLIQSISQNSQTQNKPDAEGDNCELDDEYDSDEPAILTLEGSLERGSAVRPVTLGSGTHTLATFGLHTKTTWPELDRIIQRLFRDHLVRVDKHLCLGITVDSLACYRVGAEQIQRDLTFAPMNSPEMLPFAYLVEESHINLQFKGTLESLTFDTLTPKSILSGYIDTLNRERHLFLGGVSGTGKTYLAHKLAEYLVIQEKLNGNELYVQSISGAIATFVIDHKNSKELCNYLAQLLSDPETLTPMVIILDNVHHIDELLLTKIYNDLERLQNERSVFIIGTLNSEITNPIFENYSLMPFSVESEPVKGFLERYLTRKWLQNESKSGRASLIQKPSKTLDRKQMTKVIRWLPRVWRFLNKYLMKFGLTSSHAIGPRLFTSCPMDYNGAQIWFADLWNFSILPFITESLREALTKADSNIAEQQQLFNRVKDDDPTEWIIANYPWNVSGTSICEWTDHLNRLKIEDILERDSIDGVLHQRSGSVNGASNKPPSGQNDKVNDPFMQMLLKLKEASNNDSSNDP